ncbi:MAG: cytidylate kinase-like family protein [Acidimicrobiia bacterium]|nr:cytidylate kinase-like family protein [Acidimicrobiia bacterium]
MKGRVVTISAGYGAGGAAVGPMLAERLGLPFADRLIEPGGLGRPGGVPSGPVAGEGVTDAELDEEPRSALVRSMALLSPTWNLPTAPEEPEDVPERMRELVEDSLRALVEGGGAVILGRGAAACIGRKRPWAFHVRLDGPVARRARRGALWEGIDTEAAMTRLEETDTARARYTQRLFGRDPADPSLYHLVLDSTVLTIEACVDVLAVAAEDYWAYDDERLPAAIVRARQRVATGRRPPPDR